MNLWKLRSNVLRKPVSLTAPMRIHIEYAPMLFARRTSVNNLSPMTTTCLGDTSILAFKWSMICSPHPGFCVSSILAHHTLTSCKSTSTSNLRDNRLASSWLRSSSVPAELLTINTLLPGYSCRSCFHRAWYFGHTSVVPACAKQLSLSSTIARMSTFSPLLDKAVDKSVGKSLNSSIVMVGSNRLGLRIQLIPYTIAGTLIPNIHAKVVVRVDNFKRHFKTYPIQYMISRRSASFIASVYSGLFCGTNYVFSTWGPQLSTRMFIYIRHVAADTTRLPLICACDKFGRDLR